MIPVELVKLLDGLRTRLDSNGELSSRFRAELHETIERLSANEHLDAGYLRRSRLALICATNSLTYLDSSVDEVEIEKISREIILHSKVALQGRFEMKDLEIENDKLFKLINNRISSGDIQLRALYAGMACYAAVNTVLYDGRAESSPDAEINTSPDEWPACFYASLAASGSACWENKGGEFERRKFWDWYLVDAVPKAWDVELELI